LIKFVNLFDNKNFIEINSMGNIRVYEHQKSLSATAATAITEHFASVMNVRKRQVLIQLVNDSYVLSAGAMQWMTGGVKMVADVKSPMDFLKKSVSGSVTNESAIKPKYEGTGLLMLEPTYKHILLEDVSEWNGLVLESGLFLASQSSVKHNVIMRSNLSSAAFGNEGLFNLRLSGYGIAVLESPVPKEELVWVMLENDEIKIDGSFAIAWSDSLDFRVERSSRNLIGAAISGEGLVNVYRGTGKVLLAPVA